MTFDSNDILAIIIHHRKHLCQKFKRSECYKPQNRFYVCLTHGHINDIKYTFCCNLQKISNNFANYEHPLSKRKDEFAVQAIKLIH